MFPFHLREWLRDNVPPKLKKLSLRPRMRLVGNERFDPQPSLGIKFRKGTGLVGMCLEANAPGKAQIVDFESQEFLLAIASPQAWSEARQSVTRHLEYEDAKKLSERYGQAAAFVIRARDNKQAIGCLTIELYPGAKLKLADSLELLNESAALARLLSVVLSGH